MLAGAQRLFGLRKQEFSQPLDIPVRPAIARPVNHAESIRFPRVNQRGAQSKAWIGIKIRGRLKRHRLPVAGWVKEISAACKNTRAAGVPP